MKHGTARYQKQGCRCRVCVTANSDHKRRWREKQPVVYPQHRRACQWPLEPLVALVPDLRERLKPEHNTWDRAVKNGLSDRMADQWAIRAGLHPGYVWLDWFDRGLFPGDDLFVNGSATSEPGWRKAAGYECPQSTSDRFETVAARKKEAA